MHIIFMPYGKRSEVELLLRDMEAQKHKYPAYKIVDGKRQEMNIYAQGQVRFLPFGFMEYVCPKEDADAVMKSLGFDEENSASHKFGNIRTWFFKHLLHCEPIPDFKKDKKYLWIKDNVSIIPIGVRSDGEIEDYSKEYSGWRHEAI